MKTLRICFLFALLSAVTLAQGLDPDSPRATFTLLEALATDGRIRTAPENGGALPRLFTERLDDGRTWMDYIADDIGGRSGGDPAAGAVSNNWPLIDAAVGVCLHEAEYMKKQAAAVTGTPEEAIYNSARKQYLEGAARLLGFYKNAASDTFDTNAGGLLGGALPDWTLPGEIRIHEIAGGGSLNVDTLDFTGRLSGKIELPELETMLAVPNFSFDSKGNLDLTAYGQTRFPPNDPDGVTLTIPPRRPLAFHLADDGNFSIAGGLRLGFPDGNVIEGFFDIDDPDYAFGLSFTGKITIELASEIVNLRPDVTPGEDLTLEQIAALAEFYRTFGKGLETVVSPAADLPIPDDINIGVAPEFEQPEVVLPTDVMEAWMFGFSNAEVRNKLVITNPKGVAEPDQGLGDINEMLAGLKGELLAARRGVAPKLHQVQRVRRMVVLAEKSRRLAMKSGVEIDFGDEDESNRLLALSAETAKAAVDAAAEFLSLTPPDADLRTGITAIRLWAEVSALATAITTDDYSANFTLARNRLDPWLNAYLAANGFGPQGQVIDQSLLDNLNLRDVYSLVLVAIEIDRLATVLGTDLTPSTVPLAALLKALYGRVQDLYDASVAANDEASRALYSVWMTQVGNANLVFEFATDAEATAMLRAVLDTRNAIATGGQLALANRFILAARDNFTVEAGLARRKAWDLLGIQKKNDPAILHHKENFDPTHPFFRRWYFALRKAANDGVIDAALQADSESALSALMTAFANSQSDRFAASADVEQNLKEAYDGLLVLTDLVALAEDMVGASDTLTTDLQQKWQALGTLSTTAAKDQKNHKLLGDYSGEIAAAAVRYGAPSKGLEGSLLTAFKQAGADAVDKLDDVIDALAMDLDPDGGDDKFSLPGDMQIQRLYGEIAFNRATLAWALAFGGRLSFPDINAIFELTSATLDSTGAFSLEMLAASDSAFGLSEDFALEFAIPGATGVPFTGILPLPSNNFAAAIDSFGGMGTLYYHKGEPDEQMFTAQVTYMALYEEMMLSGHQFSVDATATTQLELFTEEIMLFNGGVGFDLTTTLNGVPTQGGASVQLGDGTTPGLGFLLRPPKPGEQIKEPGLRTAADYYLTFSGSARFDFTNTPGNRIAQVTLESGTLTLPPDIFKGPGDTPPTISLQSPVCVQFDFEDPLAGIAWCDIEGNAVRLAINNVGFQIPGIADSEATDVSSTPDPAAVPDPVMEIPGFEVGVSAVLLLTGNDFPVIEKIDATLNLPIPGNKSDDPNSSAGITISGEDWRIDGLPGRVSIELNNTVRLLSLGGFFFDLLGGSNNVELPDGSTGTCQTTLTFTSNPDGSVLFELFGGMRCGFTSNIVYQKDKNGETYQSFAATVCGSFSWDLVNAPTFALDVVLIEGLFRLGGENGIGVQGVEDGDPASLALVGLQNIFNQSEATPFSIVIDGALDIAGYATFGLADTSFVFAGNGIEFRPGAFIFEVGEDSIDIVEGFLPAYLTAARLDFLQNEGLTLEELFAPTNLKLTVSGEIHLPNKAAIDGGSPGISGQVDDFSILLLDQGNGSYLPQVNTNGFGMQIQNLDIPPLGDLTGGLYIGNLQHPQQLYFAGVVGGKLNGMGAKILLAINTTGVIGACFDLNAGPNGISLAYGFQLTGATGGVSFLNGFADPCDFSSYIRMQTDPADGQMKPINDGTNDTFTETGDPPPPMASEPWEHCLVANTGGQFPVDSVNPLCMPHPSIANRIVYKGTVLDATALAVLGITASTPQLMGTVDEAVLYASTKFREAIVGTGDDFLMMLDGLTVDNPAYEYVQSLIDLALDGAQDMASAAIRNLLLGPVDCDTDGFIGNANVGAGDSPSFYDIVLELAQCGIPCQDVTLKLNGKFSHLAVSSFLHGDVGVTVSTTGSITVEGIVNLLGMPVGHAQCVYQLTDTNGNVNPSFGGIANVGLGPCEFGTMSFGYKCDDCYTALGQAFLDLLLTHFDVADTAANDLLIHLMERAVPLQDPRDLAVSAAAHFALIPTVEERVAVITEVFNLVNLKAEDVDELIRVYGPGVEAVVADLMLGFKTFLGDILQSVNMAMCFKADVSPRIFGFPLVAGGTALGAEIFFANKVEDPPGSGMFYQELNGQATISPSQMVSSALLGASGALIPPADTVNMGFSLRVPGFDDDTTALALEDPLAFATEQVATFINDAVVTFDYTLQPFGLKLANGQARAIMPRFDEHPDRQGVTWSRPSAPDLATRSEVILAALNKNLLGDTGWRGRAGQLYQLFEGADPTGCAQGIVAIRDRLTQSEMDQLDLAVDYFPYGGLIGGAELELPDFLTELPPPNFSQLFVLPDAQNVGDWIDNATDVLNNYLLASTCVGQMAMYVPAPSPGANFVLEDPQGMFDAIKAFDVNQLISRTSPDYPINELMLNGWLEVPILGLPSMRGEMNYEEDNKVFTAHLEVPKTSWVSDFLTTANLDVMIEAPPYLRAASSDVGLETVFRPALTAIANADRNAPLQTTVYDAFVNAVRDSLPKASFEAAAAINAIPPELQPYLTNTSNLTLYGFSFAHSPDHAPGSSDPYDIARQRGGLGIRGGFEFGFAPAGISIDVPNAGMSLTPSDNSTFPALNGTVQVGAFDPLPGIIPRFSNGELTFSSSPNNGAPWLRVAGNLEPFSYGVPGTGLDLLHFSGPGGRDLGATLEILRADGQPLDTSTRVLIDPAIATMPLLGQDMAITVHGARITDQFSFSSDAGETWSAGMTISDSRDPRLPPSFVIRDPHTPAGDILARINPNGVVTGNITGRGLQAFNLQLDVPCGGSITLFEGKETETTVNLGASGNCVFFIDHLGRFFIDLGEDRGINLPGVISATAHVVFGFNSTGSEPSLDVQEASTFDYGDVQIGQSATREFTVRNIGLATAVVEVTTDQPSHYTVANGTFTLDPGDTHEVAVVFHPQGFGALPATLTFASNDPIQPAQTIDLDGEGLGTPKYYQSRGAIDFGPTLVGGRSKGTITIGNAGTAPLTITSMSKSGDSEFNINPAPAGRTFAPGEGITYEVSFSPLAIAHFDGSITINVQGEPGPRIIPLDGDGAESQWFKIRDAEIAGYGSHLNDIHMDDALRGHAVGDDGVVLQTVNGGHSWIQRDFTKFDLNAIIPARGSVGQPVAEYHFEDPGIGLIYRDDSGNGYHATTATTATRPRLIRGNEAVEDVTGAWMDFSTNDYLDLGDFAMNTGNFAISMWIKPDNPSTAQSYFSKASSRGDNQFTYGISGSGHRITVGLSTWTPPVSATTGWQHIYVRLFSNQSLNRTEVHFYRNGSFIDSHNFTGTFSIPPGGRDWTLGSAWNGSTRGSYANGGMDEVYIFEGSLVTGIIATLANGGARMAIVGNEGSVFQSHTGGAKWRQVPDAKAYGWFGTVEGFTPFQWHDGGFDDDGRLFLVGDGGSPTRPPLLSEDVNGELWPAVVSGGLDPGEYFTSAFSTLNRIYNTSSTGRVYRATDTLGSWTRQGTNSIAGGALGGHVWNIDVASYAVVGINGGIMRSSGSGTPSPVTSGTSADLHDIDHIGITNTWHVVGDNGTYLTSIGSGSSWLSRDDGLTGNNRGVSAVGSDVWAAGENQEISLRPAAGPAQPFLVFDPGKLDFGFLLLGEARTLPIRVYNRGRRDLEVCDVYVSGAGYSIVESSIDRLAPGDWVTLLVRYKPTLTSDQDLGTLSFDTPEGRFKIPMTGRVSERKWRPKYVKTSTGNPINGEVIDMDWTSASRGYALLRVGSSHEFWYTANGGDWWTKANLPAEVLPLRLTALDMIGNGSSADDGYVVGYLIDARNRTNYGVIYRNLNGGTSIWTRVNLPAPNNVSIRDVAIHNTRDRVVVAAQTDVWESSNAGNNWTHYPNNLPASFSLDTVGIAHRATNATAPYIFASEDERMYWKVFGSQWVDAAHLFTFPTGQSISDYQFIDDPSNTTWAFDYGWIVGHNGLFWRQEAASAYYEWTTAENAEVFATTNLESVDFYRSGSSNRGYVCGESRVFRSTNDGRTWDLSFDGGEGSTMNVVDAINLNDAYIGGAFDGEAVIWALDDNTADNVPILSVDDLALLPDLDPGESHTVSLPLQNIGAPGFNLHSAVIESTDPLSRFKVVSASNSSVQVRFDATPEPEFAAELDPEVFLRFEQGRTANEYYDDTRNKFHAVPANGAAAPRIIQPEGARDRCLQFDGNDHADITGFGDIGDNFSLSMWVNPESAGGSQFFIGKHSSGGGTNFLLFGIHSGGYYMGVRSDFHTEGTPIAGWQHLVVTGERNGANTDVTVWRDGKILWEETLTDVVGNIAGQPWILGADRDSGGALNQYLKGCLDDVAVFNRILTPGEIAKLSTRSPLVGEHRARLVLNSNAGLPRNVDLRADVNEPGELIVFESELPGQEVVIDGQTYTMPVAFSIKATATSLNEWTEGSMHTVAIPIQTTTVVNNEGDSIDYQFECWDQGTGPTQTFCANRQMGNQTACFNIRDIAAGDAPPPAGSGVNNPTTIIEALTDTPAGPFLRISDGELNIPGLNNFTITGSAFISPLLVEGTMSSTPLSFPVGSADPWVEIGASDWNFHLGLDGLELSANQPSLTVMDVDVQPAAGINLIVQPANYRFEMSLDEDFAPFPGFVEFKDGGKFTVAYNGVSHSLALNGGVRVFETPDGWAFDENASFTLATPGSTVTVDLRDELGLPDPLFQQGQIELGWFNSASNATFSYGPAGFGLGFNGITLDLFGGPILNNASATVTTGGLLELSEAVGSIELSSDLTLAPPAGTSGLVKFSLQAGPNPVLRVSTPEMELQSSTLTAGTITIPPLSLDTSGDFDTGNIALPPLTLAAIGIVPRPDGKLENNHVRLSRVDGVLKLQARAETVFLPGCDWHQLDLGVSSNGTVSGSMSGTFCIGVESTIGYGNSDPLFQFRKEIGPYEIGFGSGGAFARLK